MCGEKGYSIAIANSVVKMKPYNITISYISLCITKYSKIINKMIKIG